MCNIPDDVRKAIWDTMWWRSDGQAKLIGDWLYKQSVVPPEVQQPIVIYIGIENTKYVWLEKDPGFDYWDGVRHVSSCKKCGVEHVPMYGFDNSAGEYEAVYVCVDCMMGIMGVVEGRPEAAMPEAVMPVPDWDEGENWYTVDADGTTMYSRHEPKIGTLAWYASVPYRISRKIDLPLGIDWRLTKQRRPENENS